MTRLEALRTGGIRRLGTQAKGFRYRRAGGGPVGRRERERIEKLRIPPAWTNVAIALSDRALVQAIGRDRAGRWQYLYQPEEAERRERRKHQKLIQFAEALPDMRRAVARDIAKPRIGREVVMACILRILSSCFLRPGSQVYADENGSIGVSTLRREHVRVLGDRVHFDFPGKSRKRQRRELKHRPVAKIVKRLLDTPGRDVFKFENGDGGIVDVRSRHINQYIKEVMGAAFSAKDFRTWAGTLICACALARAGVASGETKAVRKSKIVAAIKETAAILGNTPAVCRASYVARCILEEFEQGRVIGKDFPPLERLLMHQSRGLHRCERALLAALKRHAH